VFISFNEQPGFVASLSFSFFCKAWMIYVNIFLSAFSNIISIALKSLSGPHLSKNEEILYSEFIILSNSLKLPVRAARISLEEEN
jgi:hypothetical protein